MNLVNKSDTVKLFGLPAERGRWLLIALGIILLLCLGTVYSWSIFRNPLETLLDIGATESLLSYTFSIVPEALGKTEEDKINNLVGMLDGYFHSTGHHININVLNRETLLDAMDHPELYPQLTIRVSGYAVNFIKLTREQQLDVINRTFHEKV